MGNANNKQARDYSNYTTDQFIAELEASLKAAADNAELAHVVEEQRASLEKELEDNKARVADLENEVAELKEELIEEEKKNPNHKEKFEFNGKTYEVLVASARIPGIGDEALTALEIANSEEAQAKLVKTNSGLIRELK